MPSYRELLSGAPDPRPIAAHDVAAAAGDTRWIVLDDDPTGTQSVADLPVLTSWTVEDLAWALGTGAPAVYVMTNSRSLAPASAEQRNIEVVTHALAAARRAGLAIEFVSRSDSTLRGHFPLEPDTIRSTLDQQGEPVPDAVVVVPAFAEAGRVTVDGVHYAVSGEGDYVPVGRTEFARDATFGYRASDMRAWIAEKTGGTVTAEDVIHLGLATLRAGVEPTVRALDAALGGRYVTADIVVEEDLRVLALALHERRRSGANYLYRVGPPFARALIGQNVSAPLEGPELERILAAGPAESTPGGLVVIGSHVDLTTRQLEHLRESSDPAELELDVPALLDDRREQHLADVASAAIEQLSGGNVVVRTSRTLVSGSDGGDSLHIARSVSDAVVEVVRRILDSATPRFVIAKGGITSSDVASRGLGIRRAVVRGPMLPGIVSLWDPIDGPAAHVPYIVFAGNVGDETSLSAVVAKLS